MKFYFVFFIILLAREDLQQQEPDQSVLSYLFAQPARMEVTLKYYISAFIYYPKVDEAGGECTTTSVTEMLVDGGLVTATGRPG